MTLEEKLALPYKKLDIGSGVNFYGGKDSEWIHLDYDSADGVDIQTDWRNMPFPNETFDEVHSSETLEHIPKFQMHETLTEWNRVMKVGCRFLFTTPNLEFVIKAAYEKLCNDEWIIRNLYGDQGGYPHQHYHLYTAKTLNELLMKYGFSEVRYDDAWGAGSDTSKLQWLQGQCTKLINLGL